MWERFSFYGMRAMLVLYLGRPRRGEPGPAGGRAGAEALRLVHRPRVLHADLRRLHRGQLLGQRKAVMLGGLFIRPGMSCSRCRRHSGYLGCLFFVRARHRIPGDADQLLARPRPHRRQRLLQAEHLHHGRRPLPAGRPPPRRRLHHLLHGHQPRRFLAPLICATSARTRIRLALRLRRRQHRHAAAPWSSSSRSPSAASGRWAASRTRSARSGWRAARRSRSARSRASGCA